MCKLGEKIKEIRLKEGLSQEEFAKKLGYKSRSTINKIEKGINEISYDKLILLIKKYELETDDLKILDFQEHNILSWLAELMKHRDASDSRRYKVLSKKLIAEYGIDTSESDVIKGWRANASYFYIAKEFVRENIDIEILEEKAKPFDTLQGADGRPLDLSDYMKKHVYMYSGGDCRARIRINRAMISDVIDLFGKEVNFSDENETDATVTVYANEMSIERFALSFAPDVVVLEPKVLANKVKNCLLKAAEKYQ